MSGMVCPRCGAVLVKSFYEGRIGFACPEGHGIAMTVGAVRALCDSRELINLLWCKSGAAESGEGAACPICRRPMRVVTLEVEGQEIELDVCRRCQEIWFDPRELEALPHHTRSEELPPEAREAIALEKIKNVGRDESEILDFGGTGDWSGLKNPFQYLAVVLGLPVESEAPPLQRLPLVTWGLILVCVAVFMLELFCGLDAETLGFIPAKFARFCGATWITSMFMHGGIWHLVGNMYFLYTFGDNVEDELGKLRYLGFVLLSGFSATLLFWALRPASEIPCVGASGFISGVIAMYAVLYPDVKLITRLRIYLIGLPAWLMFLIWMLMQLLMTVLTHNSEPGGVAYAAHLGGAIPGIVCGIAMRIARRRRAQGAWTSGKTPISPRKPIF